MYVHTRKLSRCVENDFGSHFKEYSLLVSLIIRISACNKKDRVRLDVMEHKNSKSLNNIWWNNKIKVLESFFS